MLREPEKVFQICRIFDMVGDKVDQLVLLGSVCKPRAVEVWYYIMLYTRQVPFKKPQLFSAYFPSFCHNAAYIY